MYVEEARALKRDALAFAEQLLATRARAAAAPRTAAQVGVTLGLAPRGDGQFDLAVRYQLGTPTARMVVRRVCDRAGEHVDVRRTGRIRPLAAPATGRSGARGGVRVRPPVPTAQAAGLTARVRPLRPGVSIAHHEVTAGTLGGFVTRPAPDGAAGDVYALSNWHVLAGSPSARPGDVILQPGPADGGTDPQDRVGELALAAPLSPQGANAVDAALARLDDPRVDPHYPVGVLAGAGEVAGDEVVAKIGRTTGLTEGRISAIELDDVIVGYGEPLGELRFDDQIEVESIGPGAFSRGGDSGSLVYRPADRVAIGLLFAGSETGGQNDSGLTYLNPITAVLGAVGATLV